MASNKRKYKNKDSKLDDIRVNTKSTSESLEQINLNIIEINKKQDESKLKKIVNVIIIIVTISGVSVITLISMIKNAFDNSIETNQIINESAISLQVENLTLIDVKDNVIEKEDKSNYSLFIYSEFYKFDMQLNHTQANEIMATLNFDAEDVTITAYLESGNTDTLKMDRKTQYEWVKNVQFTEVGNHEIEICAVDKDGYELKKSIFIEVVQSDINFNDIFSDLLM